MADSADCGCRQPQSTVDAEAAKGGSTSMQFTLPNLKEKADVPHDLVDKVQPVEDHPGYVQAYLPDEQTIILTEDAVIGTDDERIQSVTPSEDGTTVIVEADVPPNSEQFSELWRLAI